MLAASVSLKELAQHGAGVLEHYRDRERAPETAVEWLGLAVGRLPQLSATARTIDEIPWRTLSSGSTLHAPLVDALERELAEAAALLQAALDEHLQLHPEGAAGSDPGEDADTYAAMLVQAHRDTPRRAEFLVGGFTAFLSGAIEVAGYLNDAELAAARARRWDRGDYQRTVAVRAGQLYEAIVNALGGLLAYARLTAEMAARAGQ